MRPEVLGSTGLLGLQRAAGNAGVAKLIQQPKVIEQRTVQRHEDGTEVPENAPVQGAFVQRAEGEDEEETAM
jgi:hypothetical protein